MSTDRGGDLVQSIDVPDGDGGERREPEPFSTALRGEFALAVLESLYDDAAPGAETRLWISGDHGVFEFRGIPCVAVTSSNLTERVVKLTHTAADTVDEVDVGLLDVTAEVIAKLTMAEFRRPGPRCRVAGSV